MGKNRSSQKVEATVTNQNRVATAGARAAIKAALIAAVANNKSSARTSYVSTLAALLSFFGVILTPVVTNFAKGHDDLDRSVKLNLERQLKVTSSFDRAEETLIAAKAQVDASTAAPKTKVADRSALDQSIALLRKQRQEITTKFATVHSDIGKGLRIEPETTKVEINQLIINAQKDVNEKTREIKSMPVSPVSFDSAYFPNDQPPRSMSAHRF